MDKKSLESALENTPDNTPGKDEGLRTLRDLELLLVGGGGDEPVSW
jgi:hypothetical protein